MVEPGASIRKADEFMAEEVSNRPFEADRWTVKDGKRGNPAGRDVDGRKAQLARRRLEHRAVHGPLITPVTEQVELAFA